MSEMCGTRLAGNTGRHFGTIAQVCRAISSELRHVSTIGKNLLNSITSSTFPDNMVNFGLLTAEICWRVWGTHANFNGFRVLAALLHGILLWSPYVIGRPYIFSSCSFFLLLFFPRLISAVGDWMSTILLHMAWP